MKRETSMLTFETAAVQGVAGIIDKLTVCLPLCSSFADLMRCPVTSILQSPASSLHFGCATFERNWWNTCGSDRSLTGMESPDSKVPNPGGARDCWSRMNGWHAREPRLTKNNGQWIIHRCFNCSQTALAVTSSSTISSSWYTHSRRSASMYTENIGSQFKPANITLLELWYVDIVDSVSFVAVSEEKWNHSTPPFQNRPGPPRHQGFFFRPVFTVAVISHPELFCVQSVRRFLNASRICVAAWIEHLRYPYHS